MKAKVKFDTAAIKNFFSEHVEKIVVGACVIVLCLFIKSIFSRETLPSNLQPSKISSDTTLAHTTVATSPVPPNLPDFTPSPVSDKIDSVPAEILSRVPPVLRKDNIFDDPNKRADPTMFTVANLQAYAMGGALVTPGEGGGVVLGPAAPVRRAADSSRPNALPPGTTGPATPTPATRTRGRPAVAPPATAPSGRGVIPGAAALGPGAEAAVQTVPADQDLPGAQGTGSAEYRSMIIVTGAIPVEMQAKEYELRFSHAQRAGTDNSGPSRSGFRGGAPVQSDSDIPQYVYWRLERKDLTAGGDTVLLDYGDATQIKRDRDDPQIGQEMAFKVLKPTKAFTRIHKEIDSWGALGGEVVPPEYLDSAWISWPLPGLLLHDWGREATNAKIPLKSQPVPDPNATPATPGDETKPAETDPFAGDPSNPSKAPGTTSVSPRQVPGGQATPFSGRRSPGRGLPAMNGPVGRDRSAPTGRNFGPQQIAGRPDNEAPQVPYKLFRFIDFEVQPGHTYQYRVQLVLKNPNFGLAPELLAKPDPKPLPYRDTPWSEVSNTTTVPLDSQLVAEGVDRPKKGDPKVKGGVLMWDKKEVNQLLAKEVLELGAVANFIQKKLTAIIDPSSRTVRDYTSDIVSDGALLDLHGGGDLATSVDAGGPGELLFLVIGRDGKPDQMTVVSEAADKPALDFWEKTHKVAAGAAQAAGAVPAGINGPAKRDASAPAATQPGGLLTPRGTPNNNKTPAPGRGR